MKDRRWEISMATACSISAIRATSGRTGGWRGGKFESSRTRSNLWGLSSRWIKGTICAQDWQYFYQKCIAAEECD